MNFVQLLNLSNILPDGVLENDFPVHSHILVKGNQHALMLTEMHNTFIYSFFLLLPKVFDIHVVFQEEIFLA